MSPTDLATTAQDLADLREAEAARRRRDRALTMAERLERVNQLCAQLSNLAPIRPKHSS